MLFISIKIIVYTYFVKFEILTIHYLFYFYYYYNNSTKKLSKNKKIYEIILYYIKFYIKIL